MGALLAQRISEKYKITFSIAMNDYGLELLSDQEIDITLIDMELFSTKGLSCLSRVSWQVQKGKTSTVFCCFDLRRVQRIRSG